jgi:decaprenyl-phosphate phosphoribosyltransferase
VYVNAISATIHSLRVKQWAKNLLVFVAPFAAGKSLFESSETFICFVSFCLASSIGYILNDLRDLEKDRKHPLKSLRPFAAGRLSVKQGLFIVLFLSIFLIIFLTRLNLDFILVLTLYMFITNAYTFYFKQIPVIELFMVASGFVLRLIAGAVASDLYLSEWFLIVGGFSALFIVFLKRISELKNSNGNNLRPVLNLYDPKFLESGISVSLSVSITSYCLWAFSQSNNQIFYQLSILPWVMALFRYSWITSRESIEAPEDALFKDLTLIILGITCSTLLMVAIY